MHNTSSKPSKVVRLQKSTVEVLAAYSMINVLKEGRCNESHPTLREHGAKGRMLLTLPVQHADLRPPSPNRRTADGDVHLGILKLVRNCCQLALIPPRVASKIWGKDKGLPYLTSFPHVCDSLWLILYRFSWMKLGRRRDHGVRALQFWWPARRYTAKAAPHPLDEGRQISPGLTIFLQGERIGKPFGRCV